MSEKKCSFPFQTHQSHIQRQKYLYLLYFYSLFSPTTFILAYVGTSRQKQVERHTFFQSSISAGYRDKETRSKLLFVQQIIKNLPSPFIYQNQHALSAYISSFLCLVFFLVGGLGWAEGHLVFFCVTSDILVNGAEMGSGFLPSHISHYSCPGSSQVFPCSDCS